MRKIAIPVLATLCVLASSVPTKAADPKPASYSMADAGELHVTLPAGWTGASDNATPATIEMKSSVGKHVSIQVTPVPGKAGDADLKQTAQNIGKHYAEGSKEKKVVLETVKGKAVRGYLSSYTDAAADPGEFRYVTAGVLACNDQVLAVTVLYNDKVSVDHTAALAALKTFSIAPAAGGTTQPAAAVTIDSPDGKWMLSIPGKWQIADNRKSRDGRSRQVTAMSADGTMMMTVFLEPAAKPKGDAKAARDFYLARMKKNPLGMDNLKQDAAGDVATLDYDQGTTDFKAAQPQCLPVS